VPLQSHEICPKQENNPNFSMEWKLINEKGISGNLRQSLRSRLQTKPKLCALPT
jgi:hypothetical protein